MSCQVLSITACCQRGFNWTPADGEIEKELNVFANNSIDSKTFKNRGIFDKYLFLMALL